LILYFVRGMIFFLKKNLKKALEWLPIMDLNYPEDIQLNEFERNSKKRKIEDPINLQVIVLAIGNKNGEITFWGFPLCFELKSQFG